MILPLRTWCLVRGKWTSSRLQVPLRPFRIRMTSCFKQPEIFAEAYFECVGMNVDITIFYPFMTLWKWWSWSVLNVLRHSWLHQWLWPQNTCETKDRSTEQHHLPVPTPLSWWCCWPDGPHEITIHSQSEMCLNIGKLNEGDETISNPRDECQMSKTYWSTVIERAT